MATNISKSPKARKTTQKQTNPELVSFTQTLHPDIYDRVEKYCMDFGFKPQDIVRQSVALFLIKTGY